MIVILTWGFIGLSLVALGVLLLTGQLHEKAIALGPDRDLALDRSVYLAGVVLVLGYSALQLSIGGLKQPQTQMLLMLIPFVLTGLLIGRAVNVDGGLRRIGIVPRRPQRDVQFAVVATVIGFGLANAVGLAANMISEWWGQEVSPVAHETLKELRENPTAANILFVFLSAVILAPLLEESVFRGVLQTSLMRLMNGLRWPALVLTSAVFAVIHYWVVPWPMLFSLFVLGLVFGYVYERTGSLLTPMLTHAAFNAINIGIALSMPEA